MKKHVITFGLLTVLLITTLLVGCGGGGGGQTTTTTTSKSLSDILHQAGSFPTVYYEIVTTTNQIKMTIKYWMKNKKIRTEMPDSGVITFMDMEAHTMYMYNEATKTAIKMTYDPGQAPENPNQILEYTPNIVGTETIDEKNCTVIEYHYQGTNVKTWIWNDYGYPVRMETTTNGVTSVVEWKNFDFSDIADSMFELPEGVEVIDMGG